jgi:hypothetical protein
VLEHTKTQISKQLIYDLLVFKALLQFVVFVIMGLSHEEVRCTVAWWDDCAVNRPLSAAEWETNICEKGEKGCG